MVKIKINDIHVSPVELSNYSSPEQLRKIDHMAEKLKAQSQLEPIVVNEDLSIIWKGHTRYLAAKKLGWKDIDVKIMTSEEWSKYLREGGQP